MANEKTSRKSAAAAAKREQRRIEQERAAKRKQMMMIIGGVAAVAIIAVIGLILVNHRKEGSNQLPIQAAAAPDASIPVEGLTIGDPNAPVKIVEYGDYQCPYCAQFNTQGMPLLLNEYISSGKVHFTFVPFSFLGDESLAAAEAVLCANDQNKFWVMHETVYANHNGENQGAYSKGRLKEMAAKAGLDTKAFNSCMDSGTHRGDVQNYNASSRQAGISSTPSFIINGGQPVGYSNWNEFKAEIDRALGAA